MGNDANVETQNVSPLQNEGENTEIGGPDGQARNEPANNHGGKQLQEMADLIAELDREVERGNADVHRDHVRPAPNRLPSPPKLTPVGHPGGDAIDPDGDVEMERVHNDVPNEGDMDLRELLDAIDEQEANPIELPDDELDDPEIRELLAELDCEIEGGNVAADNENHEARVEPDTAHRPRPPRLTPMERLQKVKSQKRQPGKRTRASLKIATLNMKGRKHKGEDKWTHVNQIIRDGKIGILVLQETHLPEADTREIEGRFPRLKIISSVDENHSRAHGVAIVLNKDITKTEEISFETIITGRAILVTTKWHEDETLRLLVVYAPCPPGENGAFWDELNVFFATRPSPNAMLGDFNVVESAIDRLPEHDDAPTATIPLGNLKRSWSLVDGWRQTFPDRKAYTFKQAESQGGAQSRIDRIYLKQEMITFSKDWEINPPGISTDHQLVTVRISARQMPFIGNGRWTMPLFLLSDKKLMKKIGKSVKEAEEKMEESEDERQIIYAEWKAQTITELRDAAKMAIPKMEKEIREKKVEMNTINNNMDMTEEERKAKGGAIQEEIDKIAKKKTREDARQPRNEGLYPR